MNFSHWHWLLQLLRCRFWPQKIASRVWGHLKKRDNPNSLDDDALYTCAYCVSIAIDHNLFCMCPVDICCSRLLSCPSKGISNLFKREVGWECSYRCGEKDGGCTASELHFTIIATNRLRFYNHCKEETQPKLLIIVFFRVVHDLLFVHLCWDAPESATHL